MDISTITAIQQAGSRFSDLFPEIDRSRTSAADELVAAGAITVGDRHWQLILEAFQDDAYAEVELRLLSQSRIFRLAEALTSSSADTMNAAIRYISLWRAVCPYERHAYFMRRYDKKTLAAALYVEDALGAAVALGVE